MKSIWSLNSYHRDETRYSISFTFSDTFKDVPSTHQNFTLLDLTSHEIPEGGGGGGGGGGCQSPWHPLWVPKSLIFEGLRRQYSAHFVNLRFRQHFII